MQEPALSDAFQKLEKTTPTEPVDLTAARDAVLEECAKLAEQLSTGVAVEVNGRQIPLGCMHNDPTYAQLTTAHAIAAAIRGLRDSTDSDPGSPALSPAD